MTPRHRHPHRRRIRRLLLGGTLATLLATSAATAVTATAAADPAPGPAVASLQQPPQEEDPEERARAAERAAKAAAAAERIRASWEARGRPSRMTVVRADRIDVVTEGRLSRQVLVRPGVLTLGTLDRSLPPDWLSIADGTALLSTTVVMTTGAALNIGDVQTLQLAGGATSSDAASIYTGGGRLTLRGVTVTSIDPASRQPLAPGAGRPSIVVSARGALEATDATISDLGAPAVQGGNSRAGLVFNPGATGALVRTALLRNSTGLELSGSQAVRLEAVTVADSTADGIVLRGDRATAMSDIRAERNGANGVMVYGESTDRPITGVSTSGNGEFGLTVVGQTGAQLTGLATTADKAGGLRLSRCTGTVVTAFTAADQPVGVFTNVHTTDTVLDHVQTSGGRRGIVVEKSTRGVTATASRIQDAHVAGVVIGGQDVELKDAYVADSGTGVRIERGAAAVSVTGLTVEGGRDGIVAGPGSSGVVMRNLVVSDVSADAVRTQSPGTQIIGARIDGGTTGIDAGAATTITDTSINSAGEGIRSRSPELVHADRVDVHTTALGINAAAGSPVLLTGSRVHALEALRGDVAQQGTNELSLPPLNLLGAIGVPLIILAIVLEQVHAFRYRRAGSVRRRPPPVLPTNLG